MRIQKGKPAFGFRDTHHVRASLAPIIHAWLIKFKSVIETGKCSVPQKFCSTEEFNDDSDTAIDRCWREWLSVLDEMIYAFGADEPKQREGQPHEDFRLELERHNNRVKKGLELFAVYFDDLWN